MAAPTGQILRAIPIATAIALLCAAGARAEPSLGDSQLRGDQEALADTRERRLRATGDALETRERTARENANQLERRERELTSREQQLAAREKRLAVRGSPTRQERDLEAFEAQLAAKERMLAAQERSFGPAVDAAEGRVREMAARVEAERQEASRLAASAAGAGARAQRLELRRRALGARNRHLAALEAKLVALGERIDAVERQSRARGERIDTWQRRLDARAERLDLLERRQAEPGAPSPGAPAKPEPEARPAKDRPAFAVVVKSPTSMTLETGETGKRQIREAVQAAGSSIEACVGELMEQRKLRRAEGILNLVVSPNGKVAKLRSRGDLGATSVGECLAAGSGGWVFPTADAEYVVDVPVTVIAGGASR